MSQGAFQAALARLVADPDFRDAVRSGSAPAFDDDLTELERHRLLFVAGDRGLDITRTLHKGFRYGKLRTLLPLTCTLLGEKILATEIGEFWRSRVCQSFYYIEEALAFCDHLQERMKGGLRRKYLREVLSYERAVLELQSADTPSGTSRQVRFRHDPVLLLASLSSGIEPRGIALRRCMLVGSLSESGEVEWGIVDREMTMSGS
jgi:hypothetical protein